MSSKNLYFKRIAIKTPLINRKIDFLKFIVPAYLFNFIK